MCKWHSSHSQWVTAERETEWDFEDFGFFIVLGFVLHVRDIQELAINKIQVSRREIPPLTQVPSPPVHVVMEFLLCLK